MRKLESLLMFLYFNSSREFRGSKAALSRDNYHEISGYSSEFGVDDWVCDGRQRRGATVVGGILSER